MNPSPQQGSVFAVRIVICDHYTWAPTAGLDPEVSDFRLHKIRYVPILRVFGSTPAGQKCCLHVHGVFPYFYVISPVQNDDKLSAYMRRLAEDIDSALNASFAADQQDGRNAYDRQYVYEIKPVFLTPFYGYHVEKALFLKISFYSPSILKRAAELLQNGAIMDYTFQPYELHIPFELQFFIDHDLYGMDFLHVSKIKFRKSDKSTNNRTETSTQKSDLASKLWDLNTLPASYMLSDDVQRISVCELEADCLSTDIILCRASDEKGGNPGLRFIWKDEKLRREAMRLDVPLEIPVSQDRSQQPILPSEMRHFESLEKILIALKEKRVEESSNVSNITNAPAESQDGSILNAFMGLLDEAEEERRSISSIEEYSDDDQQKETAEMSQRILEDSSDEEEMAWDINQVDGPTGDHSDDSSIVLSGDSDDLDEPVVVSDTSGSEKSYNDVEILSTPRSPDSNDVSSSLRSVSNETNLFFEVSTSPELDVSSEEIMSSRQSTSSVESASVSGYTQLKKQDITGLAEYASIIVTPSVGPPNQQEMNEWLLRNETSSRDSILEASERSQADDEDIDKMAMEDLEADLAADESVVGSECNRTLTPGTRTVSRARSSSSGRISTDSTVVADDASVVSRRKRSAGWKSFLSQTVSFISAHDVEYLEDIDENDVTPTDQSQHEQPQSQRKKTLENKVTVQRVCGQRKANQSKRYASKKAKKSHSSDLEAPSVVNSFGFNTSELNLAGAKVSQGASLITIMSLEVHVHTRGDLRPDPEFDALKTIFCAVHCQGRSTGTIFRCVITVCENDLETHAANLSRGMQPFELKIAKTEVELFDILVDAIRRFDPDILCGYEVQLLSWGFVLERATKLGVELCPKISRIPDMSRQSRFSTTDSTWWLSDIHVAGRLVLNLWRIFRHEVNLYMYSLENVVHNVLRLRIPFYSSRKLTEWYSALKTRARVFDYYLIRVTAQLEVVDRCDILNRSSEFARLYGIQFFEVLTRGSQFRVESMLLRMTKAENYIALSPSVRQRNKMAAPECVALTMEPISNLYTDPVLVLDFQSLYPSMVIAYNLCYSTCLGKLRNYTGGERYIEFGCHRLKVTEDLIESLLNDIHISPAGVVFVKETIRKGILPRMLEEILNTRVMVKQSMKLYRKDKALQKILDSRQLGLKLIANVTYGYTSANFSGRMPCVEIADSIVHKGRETLQNAISMVEDNPKWGAKIVYGDTDSMFILLAGRSKGEAFQIGQEIADAVTKANPKPVKLKFEKVFYPCILQAKKRYVGYSYETREQKTPVFDAKGIETVRRDVCPAVAKILRKAIEIMFRANNVDMVKNYTIRQFQRMYFNRVSPLDFIFAKEYRGRDHYKPGAVVPALVIAKRRLQRDRRAEPRIKERVPYVIVHMHPNATLISCVREPDEFAVQRGLRINYKYYINKQICPALNRVFSLIGQNTFDWHKAMSKVDRALYNFGCEAEAQREGTVTLSQYFRVSECVVCREPTSRRLVCMRCSTDKQDSGVILANRMRMLEQRLQKVNELCSTCTAWRSGSRFPISECASVVCPVMFKKLQLDSDHQRVEQLRKVLTAL